MKASAVHLGIGKIASVVIVVVIVFAALVGIGLAVGPSKSATSSSSTSTSSTQAVLSTSSTTSSTPTTSTTASSTSQTSSASNSGGPLAIVVSAITIDRTPFDAPAGYITYIYDVTITNVDSVSHLSDEVAFTAISGTNAVYDITLAAAVRQPLPSVTLSPGQHASGQVAFQVPNGEQIVKLEYNIPAELVDVFVTNLPQPSSWVSEVGYADATIQGVGANNYFVLASIENSTVVYYSTDRMVVNLTLWATMTGTASIQVTSITVSNQGLHIVNISPTLPVTIPGDGTKVSLTLILTLPQTGADIQELSFNMATS